MVGSPVALATHRSESNLILSLTRTFVNLKSNHLPILPPTRICPTAAVESVPSNPAPWSGPTRQRAHRRHLCVRIGMNGGTGSAFPSPLRTSQEPADRPLPETPALPVSKSVVKSDALRTRWIVLSQDGFVEHRRTPFVKRVAS